MKTIDYTDKLQRRVLIGMIVNPYVLGMIASKWTGDNFASSYANIVANLCIRHWQKHAQPPGKGIRSLYERWAERHPDRDPEEQASKFIARLRDEFSLNGELNTQLIIDQAGEHFNYVRLERLRAGLDSDLRAKKYDRAEERLVKALKPIELGIGVGKDIFHDPTLIASSLRYERLEPVIKYHQRDLDSFFQSRLVRGAFVSFLAPEKIGKTAVMVDLAIRAMLQRRRVAFFSVGDDTEDDIVERLVVRLSEHPFDARKWPHEIKIPTKIIKPLKTDKDQTPKVRHRRKTFEKQLDYETVLKKYKEAEERDIKSSKCWFQLSVHKSVDVGMVGIKSAIDGWVMQGWIPDAIFIDYADNLAPPRERLEPRDAINRNWQLMRAISQEGYLVITATQANRQSYEERNTKRSHISEDKRKLAHLTGMCAISTAAEEKERGLLRLSWCGARRRAYSPRKHIWVAGCWDICQPCMVSTF